jgi:uncharacterized protein YpmB
MNEIFLLIIVCCCLVAAYDVQRLRKQYEELLELSQEVINYSFDIERNNYIETYGEEENNYLWLDSDLELHIDQEENEHIYKTLHKLQRLVSNTTL